MIREKSAGVIIFRHHRQEGIQYLILYHRGSYWNFPKGKVAKGEKETETALREFREETGIGNLKLINNWRQETHFFFKEERNGQKQLIRKQFVLFLAKLPPKAEVKISREHNGYGWFSLPAAKKHLQFKNLKEILEEADYFINEKIKEYRKK